MSRPDTWMPMYWGDYVKDTGNFSAAHHGAYLMLIKHYWCSGGPLPDDDDQLWRIAACDGLEHWQKIRPLIAAKFEIEGGLWRHKRVEIEMERADKVAKARRESGKRGGEAKAKAKQTSSKKVANLEANDLANGKQKATPSQSQSPSKIHESEKGNEAAREVKTEEPDLTLPDHLRRNPSPHRVNGMRPVGAFVTPDTSRLKRQDVADKQMAEWLASNRGMTLADAWLMVMAARDEDADGHDEARKVCSRASAENRIGWFAGERV